MTYCYHLANFQGSFLIVGGEFTPHKEEKTCLNKK